MKAFIYVTKAKPYLFYQGFIHEKDYGKYMTSVIKPDEIDEEPVLNGKIAASFGFNEAENISQKYAGAFKDGHFYDILKKACLTVGELEKYCPTHSGKKAFAWHIDSLEVLNHPWTLKSFMSADTTYPGWEEDWKPLNEIKKAPQSWMYAIAYYEDGDSEPCLLISVNPQWACKILNGEKTIEIRHTLPKGVKIE